MAQFDLHKNKGPLKDSIPYVVVVQSSLFDGYRRRVVVPLVRRSVLSAGIAGTRMNPSFKVRGAVLVLHPLDMVSVACDQLGECVGSLAEHGQEITDARDELLTRSWQLVAQIVFVDSGAHSKRRNTKSDAGGASPLANIKCLFR